MDIRTVLHNTVWAFFRIVSKPSELVQVQYSSLSNIQDQRLEVQQRTHPTKNLAPKSLAYAFKPQTHMPSNRSRELSIPGASAHTLARTCTCKHTHTTHNQAEIPLLSPPPLSRTRACELATKRYRGMSQRSNKPRGTGACRSAASSKPTRSI